MPINAPALRSSALIVFLCFFLGSAFSQITTGSIKGKIKDSENQSIPFANISLLHQPTGVNHGASSDEVGNYVIDNLKPGGPYQLSITYVGYRDRVIEEIYVSLGKALKLDLTLESSTVKELMEGAAVSVLLTVMDLLLVAEFPAASETVAVSEILVVPKL